MAAIWNTSAQLKNVQYSVHNSNWGKKVLFSTIENIHLALCEEIDGFLTEKEIIH